MRGGGGCEGEPDLGKGAVGTVIGCKISDKTTGVIEVDDTKKLIVKIFTDKGKYVICLMNLMN